MSDEVGFLKGTWKVTVRDAEGNLVGDEEHGNIVVDLGRVETIKDIFGVGAISGFLYLGVGSGSVAAAATDTTLGSEITLVSVPPGSLADRVNLTDSTGNPIDGTDVVADATVPPYRQKIVVQGVYATTDNNGTTFQEFGIFSSDTFGAGTMLNRFVLGSPISKTSSISVTVQITIRM